MRHCGNVFFICTSCACKIGICMPSNFNWKEKILQEQVEQDSTECPLSQGSSTIRCWSARRVWPHPSTLRPPAWCCPCPSCQLPPPPSQPLPPFPGWVYQACCPPCRSFQEFQLCRALGCQGCQDYCLECQRCQQSNRENCWRCGEWGCGEPALVSRANWQSIPVLWWLGLPSLGKQTHWRPFALKKCAATAFWICLRSVCVCVFGFKKSSDVFLSSIYSHLAGKTLEIAAVTFEALSQVGLFEKKEKPSYCRSMRKATFQKHWIWMFRSWDDTKCESPKSCCSIIDWYRLY